jgi:hypothetical protein
MPSKPAVRLRQGSNRHALAQRGNDLYETPIPAIRALLQVEPITHRVWEPAAGRGAIVRALNNWGYETVATDLIAYEGAIPGIGIADFFSFTRAPGGCKVIVTNPPFKDADRFVRHGLSLVPKVIVLQRLAALEGVGRSDLVDKHLQRVWLGRERLSQMHREGWTGPKLKETPLPFAWYVFTQATNNGRIQLQRMSWRAE